MAVDRPDLKPLVGQQVTVIAWLWARTVKSPNPAFSHIDVPLASTFVLSSKEGKEAYVEPIVKADKYRFTVKLGLPPATAKNGTKVSRGAFRCLHSDTPIKYEYIDDEANAGRMGVRLMAIVADTSSGRVYLPPDASHEAIAKELVPTWKPEAPCRGTFASNAQGRRYGFKTFGDYFTARQLVALTTIADLVGDAIEHCKQDAIMAGFADDSLGLDAGGLGATAYAEAVGVHLGLAVDKTADYNSSLVAWSPTRDQAKTTFSRQGLPMVWDFAEVNTLAGAAGDIDVSIKGICRSISMAGPIAGIASQADAQDQRISAGKIVSTDPPYYDNITYADLSDFFYVWLRKSLRPIYPALYATLVVPKAAELIATTYRHASKEDADQFFLQGMKKALHSIAEQVHPAFPVTVYYALKQSETEDDVGTFSSGWETFLEAVVKAGLAITGTWPIRTERDARAIGIGANVLASSILLVCRPRLDAASIVSRREFIRELNAALPDALDEMTRGGVNSPVAPVDLSQAIIGPGMAIFSKYKAVLEADGTPMSVRTALKLINRFFAEDDFDHDTQFCLHWFDNSGWAVGKFGEADVLARAKGTAVGGLVQAGVVESSGGNLRLFRWAEYPADWAPEADRRASVWEALHQLIRALKQQGDSAAGGLLARMPEKAEPVRALAYRLYTLCERKGWAEDARAYNELITSWAGIEAASHETGHTGTQAKLEL